MITLHPDEQIILTVRRHWFFLAAESLFLVALFIIPIIGFGILSELGKLPLALTVFWTAAWWLFLWVAFTLIWTNYDLDAWLITNKRIVDIEQHGLFSREISECRLDRVQDVTVEIRGILPTMLHFGDVSVQTAGEAKRFVLRSVPQPDSVKDIISKQQENTAQTILQSAMRGE